MLLGVVSEVGEVPLAIVTIALNYASIILRFVAYGENNATKVLDRYHLVRLTSDRPPSSTSCAWLRDSIRHCASLQCEPCRA